MLRLTEPRRTPSRSRLGTFYDDAMSAEDVQRVRVDPTGSPAKTAHLVPKRPDEGRPRGGLHARQGTSLFYGPFSRSVCSGKRCGNAPASCIIQQCVTVRPVPDGHMAPQARSCRGPWPQAAVRHELLDLGERGSRFRPRSAEIACKLGVDFRGLPVAYQSRARALYG